MRVGTAQIDITPAIGAALGGFALREQPSIGRLDPLFAVAVYLEDSGRRFLWIHADLIGLDRAFINNFRNIARQCWGLSADQVLLSATHTHSGPATVYLFEAGGLDKPYLEQLLKYFEAAAKEAMRNLAECHLAVGLSQLDLAVDRRGKPSAHVDPQVAVAGLRDEHDRWRAVMVNFAMHPVTLGHTNRHISADFCGATAATLSDLLPGRPVVLVTNGACGNLNPPAQDVPSARMQGWGDQLARVALQTLTAADDVAKPRATFETMSRRFTLPPQDATIQDVEAHARRFFLSPDDEANPATPPGLRITDRAARNWLARRTEALRQGNPAELEAELLVLRLGDLNIIGINAEVFSRFTEIVRREIAGPVCTLGYANGDIGYLPTRQAYAEGGYEVNTAMFFYDLPLPQIGSLERLADEAVTMIRSLSTI